MLASKLFPLTYKNNTGCRRPGKLDGAEVKLHRMLLPPQNLTWLCLFGTASVAPGKCKGALALCVQVFSDHKGVCTHVHVRRVCLCIYCTEVGLK